MACARNRASMREPMPQRSRSSSGWSLWGRSSGRITTRPSGFIMSEAVLARNSFGARPMEQVSRGAFARMASLIRPAKRRAASTSIHSPQSWQWTSSMERTSGSTPHSLDGFVQEFVAADVPFRARLDDLQIRAEPPGFVDGRAGFDAERLRFPAGGDAAGGFRHQRHDDHRPVAQLRPQFLLHRGEEGIEVDEHGMQKRLHEPTFNGIVHYCSSMFNHPPLAL